jgi:hypothetical protein
MHLQAFTRTRPHRMGPANLYSRRHRSQQVFIMSRRSSSSSQEARTLGGAGQERVSAITMDGKDFGSSCEVSDWVQTKRRPSKTTPSVQLGCRKNKARRILRSEPSSEVDRSSTQLNTANGQGLRTQMMSEPTGPKLTIPADQHGV